MSEFVKCPNCHWMHYVTDEELPNRSTCGRCNWSALFMVGADFKDLPIGCMIPPINREALDENR